MIPPRASARTRAAKAFFSLALVLLTGAAGADALPPSGSPRGLEPGPVPHVLDARLAATPETFLAAPGRVEAFDDAYRRWFALRLRKPRLLRALTESMLLLGLGTAYYWSDPLANSADWDYPSFGDKLRFESVRFDNNLFATNHILHPLAGAANYGLSRVNGFTPAGALASTIIFSVVWEFALEYREQTSVNDMLFTPFGGAAIGEFLFQLGDYLNSAPGGASFPRELARATLGLPQLLHNALDGVRAPQDPPRDSLGLSSAFWHRFGLGYEATLFGSDTRVAGNLHGFRVDAALAAMPGFLRPGQFRKGFHDGNFVELRARAGWGDDDASEVDLWVMADLLGLYAQDFEVPGAGRPSGHATLLSLATAFRFNQRELLGFNDRFAVAHLLGPRAAAWFASEGLLASLDASIHGDFAGIHPLAFPAWQEVTPDDGVKTVLAKERYVYAFGFSTRLRGRLSFRGLELGAFVHHGQYESIEGIDRHEELVTQDLHTRDTILELGGWAEVAAPGAPLSLRLGAEVLRRTGTLATVASEREERRLSMTPGLRF